MVELLCAEMVYHFGGVQQFAEAWHQQVDTVRAESPGSKKLGDFYLAVLRMLQYCDENRPDFSHMTDDELNRYVADRLVEMIRQEPELAVSAAQEIGWTVIPPSESQPTSDFASVP